MQKINRVLASDNEAELFRCLSFVNVTFDKYNLVMSYKVEMPGVYIVADSNYNVLYIGQAVNIYKRLKQPTHPVKKKITGFSFDHFKFLSLVISEDDLRYRAETVLIGALAPIYNSVKYLNGKVSARRKT